MTQATTIQPAQPMKAAVCVVAAMALIGLVDNFVVRIAAEIGLWQFQVMRTMMAVPVILVVGIFMRWPLRPRRFNAVALRSLFLALSMLCYFGALGFLTVAEVVAGLFTAPVFVVLLTVLWFRETVPTVTLAAVSLGFTGSLLVLQPNPAELQAIGLLPIAGGMFYALSAVSTRRICAGEGTLTLLLGFLFAMFVLGIIGLTWTTLWSPQVPAGPEGFLRRGWTEPSVIVLGLTALQAMTVVVGVGLITRGYILADAAHVAVFEYSLLIFAAFWGWMLWADTLDGLGVLGAALILASGLLLMRSERQELAA